MKFSKCSFGWTVAGILAVAGVANAATYTLRLTSVTNDTTSGAVAAVLIADGGDWVFDDVAQTITAGGVYTAEFQINPFNTIFTHNIVGYSLDLTGSGIASAASYACIEGNFGVNVGANICGNYSFGDNFTDESEASWGPGTQTFKSMNTTGGIPNGGDDNDVGPIQNITQNDGFAIQSWDGQTLVISNVIPEESGYTYTFVTAPGGANAVGDFYMTPGGTVSAEFNIGANDTGWSANASVTDEVSGTNTGNGSAGGTFVIVGSGGVSSPTDVIATYTPPTPAFVGTETWV